jgi:hypothetical protein
MIGSTICKYKNGILNYFDEMSDTFYYLILVVSLFVFTIDYNTDFLPKNINSLVEKIEGYILALPSSIFLIYTLTKRAKNLMNNKYLIF